MKKYAYLSNGLTPGAFLLIGTLAVAQATPATNNAATTKTAAATTAQSRDAASGMASGKRQDQFGHASGLATNNIDAAAPTADKSLGSAHATESLQKKHLGNVKYNDFKVARSGTATNGQPSEMGINEQGVPAKPTATNKMAIKENGISKPKGAANVQPYKDPEDMTTRSRPSNNTTAVNSSKTPKVDSLSIKQ